MKITEYSPFYQTLVGTILGGIVVFLLTTYIINVWFDNLFKQNKN